ncbi:Aspartate aminotransferase, cytoplasmic [Rhizina undulata]
MAPPIPTPVTSAFNAVPLAPTDPLFGLMATCKSDTSEKKVDLGVGTYRDDNAKPWVLPVVKKAAKAKEILSNDPDFNHEYLPFSGLQSFTSGAAKLILGHKSAALKENRVASIQAISGTGAVHIGAALLAKFYPRPQGQRVYLSAPTWANHHQIFNNVHLPITNYPYFHAPTKGLDFNGFYSSLATAPEGSIILLHACAHNPTGVDPTKKQWRKLAEVMKKKRHFPFLTGFASGNLNVDAWAVRYFVENGFEMCIAQSFAKNLGLYGERVGCFHFISPPIRGAAELTAKIFSQLAILQRSEISFPPAFGAKIAGLILNDDAMFRMWVQNLEEMSGRIKDMRTALYNKLVQLGTPGDWTHITKQIGMFSFTGLTEKQVLKLREEAHVDLTKNGRISMAGLNTHNVEYFATAVDKVVREVQK